MDNRYYVDEKGPTEYDYDRGDYRKVAEGTHETYAEMEGWHYEPRRYSDYSRSHSYDGGYYGGGEVHHHHHHYSDRSRGYDEYRDYRSRDQRGRYEHRENEDSDTDLGVILVLLCLVVALIALCCAFCIY